MLIHHFKVGPQGRFQVDPRVWSMGVHFWAWLLEECRYDYAHQTNFASLALVVRIYFNCHKPRRASSTPSFLASSSADISLPSMGKLSKTPISSNVLSELERRHYSPSKISSVPSLLCIKQEHKVSPLHNATSPYSTAHIWRFASASRCRPLRLGIVRFDR